MNLNNHPCFNAQAHHTYGRVHLPVAPRCNIQCKFCNRKFDCVNESRPGVSSGILTPAQAMVYLDQVFEEKKNMAVVGIAGPGDPFANPRETLRTMNLVRRQYPDTLLCVATNGLELEPYLDDLAALEVSHVTVTVNAVDPKIGAKIYSWVRNGRRVLRAEEGAALLLERQMSAIAGLKERGLTVKVNAILLPGVNDHHLEKVARQAADLKVDLFNCMPYYPNPGSAFEHLDEPSPDLVHSVRAQAGQLIKQMRHCTRCRADAAGLLGEAPDEALMVKLQMCERLDVEESSVDSPDRPHVAVASLEGVLVNQHLGQAHRLLIYGRENGRVRMIDARPAPLPGGGDKRWQDLVEILSDCRAVLAGGVGDAPRRALEAAGLEVHEMEGLIDDAVLTVLDRGDLRPLMKRSKTACSKGCSGTGLGCG